MTVEGRLARDIAEEARALTRTIAEIERQMKVPLTLDDVSRLRQLVHPHSTTLRSFMKRGVNIVARLAERGTNVLYAVGFYESCAELYFSAAAENARSQQSTKEVAEGLDKICDQSNIIKTTVVGYLKDIRRTLGNALEGIE